MGSIVDGNRKIGINLGAPYIDDGANNVTCDPPTISPGDEILSRTCVQIGHGWTFLILLRGRADQIDDHRYAKCCCDSKHREIEPFPPSVFGYGDFVGHFLHSR